MFEEQHGMNSINHGFSAGHDNSGLHFGGGFGSYGSVFGFGHVLFWVALAGVAFIAWRMYLVVSSVGEIVNSIPVN